MPTRTMHAQHLRTHKYTHIDLSRMYDRVGHENMERMEQGGGGAEEAGFGGMGGGFPGVSGQSPVKIDYCHFK